MIEITATVNDRGRAVLDLACEDGGEVRDSVALDELEAADRVPALGSLVPHFDFYGRLARIQVRQLGPFARSARCRRQDLG